MVIERGDNRETVLIGTVESFAAAAIEISSGF